MMKKTSATMRNSLISVLLCVLTGVLTWLVTMAQVGAQEPKTLGSDRKAFFQLLKHEKIITPELALIHFSHICDLWVDGKSFYVLDVEQQIPDMLSPRGVNQIVILDAALKPLHKLPFASERPLRCDGNRLLVSEEFVIPGQEPGNVLVFTNDARDVVLEKFQWEMLKPLGDDFPG